VSTQFLELSLPYEKTRHYFDHNTRPSLPLLPVLISPPFRMLQYSFSYCQWPTRLIRLPGRTSSDFSCACFGLQVAKSAYRCGHPATSHGYSWTSGGYTSAELTSQVSPCCRADLIYGPILFWKIFYEYARMFSIQMFPICREDGLRLWAEYLPCNAIWF
jgi:hypothetical protein